MGYTLKINNVDYKNIDRLQVPLADGAGLVDFWDGASMKKMIEGQRVDLYENPYILNTESETDCFDSCFICATTCVLPSITKITRMFTGVNAYNLILPNASSNIPIRAFLGIKNNNCIEIGKNITSISDYAFTDVKQTVILRGQTSVPTGVSAASFQSKVTVYVPSSLIDAFVADETWATVIANKNLTIAAIEGSAYESANWYKEV